MKRTTYRVQLAYDGFHFCGFAQQKNQISVEGEILAVLRPEIENIPALAVGGRTDKGVHATGQVISFWSHEKYSIGPITKLLNDASEHISIQDVRIVSRSFHARFSANGRRYVYFHPYVDVSIDHMNRMLLALIGRRCFSAFARDTPKGKSTIRTLWDAKVRECNFNNQKMIRFDFAADGFLRRQIRILVATTLREAAIKSADNVLLEFARKGDRAETAPAVDAGGLYLSKILYPPL